MPTSRVLGRRLFFGYLASVLATHAADASTSTGDYPSEVAGVRLPATEACKRAYRLCRRAAPDFLVNHSLRTYIFGALYVTHKRRGFNEEWAFVAAMFHDLGLLKEFSTPNTSFEVDGANRAESVARESGAPLVEARNIWNAIVMHDMDFAIAEHESPEAMVVAAGAGIDFDGHNPEGEIFTPAITRNVVSAIPRLQFKERFIALLADHCGRKLGVQNGTWLEGFCRAHSNVPPDGTEEAARSAPFNE
jgi:hypothetical protein